MTHLTPIGCHEIARDSLVPPFLARLALWAMVLLLFLLSAAPAHAKRIALVVGNAAYAEKPLSNPVNDAELMQRTLRDLGFEVTLLRNASRRDLLAGLRDFEAKATDAEVALFYFAGHGTQVGGNNYLIPLQAQIRAESDVPDEAVDAGSVLRRLESARVKVGLVVLDACRDNPYASSSRSSARGLGRMSVPTGSIVAYATAPGSTADDGIGSGRRNGVYTEQLAKQLATPGLDLREVFDRTAIEVERITEGKQRPREDVGLRTRVVLKQMPITVVASVVPEPVRPMQPQPAPVIATTALPPPIVQKVTLMADVFFDADGSALSSEFEAELEGFANKVKGINLEVLIAVGHADTREGQNTHADYAQRLSVARAQAVKAYLAGKGIESNRIYTEGKGSSQPIADNATENGRAKNRRVVLEAVGTVLPMTSRLTLDGQKVTIANAVYFDTDKSAWRPESTAGLDELANKVKAINLEVLIAVGHADSREVQSKVGDYGQRLSVRRAEAVKAYLSGKGIESNRIYTEGKGSTQPVAVNSTATGRAKNRRVEVEMVGTR